MVEDPESISVEYRCDGFHVAWRSRSCRVFACIQPTIRYPDGVVPELTFLTLTTPERRIGPSFVDEWVGVDGL